MSSIPLMLEYVSGLGARPGDREAARAILAHEDYRFELRRYEIPSAEHLIDYFSRLDTIPPEDIPDLSGDHRKNNLREKHSKWLDCLRDPRKYEDRYERLKALFTDDFLAEMQGRLAGMFPEGTDMIPDPAVVSTLSFGRSFGYPHEGAIHLDLFGIDEYVSLEDLPRIVLHEMHHLQMMKIAEGISGEQSLLDQYGEVLQQRRGRDLPADRAGPAARSWGPVDPSAQRTLSGAFPPLLRNGGADQGRSVYQGGHGAAVGRSMVQRLSLRRKAPGPDGDLQLRQRAVRLRLRRFRAGGGI